MTLPGLGLFYGGLVRAKNMLSILMQCMAIACLITILWVAYGYSIAFSEEGVIIGGLSHAFLTGIDEDQVVDSAHITEDTRVVYQLTFAIITPALICGAYVERMKFSAVLVFSALWFTFAYLPLAHMTWSGENGLFEQLGEGVLDFAGGTVVHINAGAAALVCAVMLGKREGWPQQEFRPHSVTMTAIGTGMLWVGWFGFNGGSEQAADVVAGAAVLVTQIAAATAGFTWMIMEWTLSSKPTTVGLCTGVVAGLVAITPGAGFVGPGGALVFGFLSAVICYFSAHGLKAKFGFDDSLDVVGVHGVGGIVGCLLTGIFCAEQLGGVFDDRNVFAQVGVQLLSAVITIVWSAVFAFISLKITAAACGGLRVEADQEERGLDLSLHNELAYDFTGLDFKVSSDSTGHA